MIIQWLLDMYGATLGTPLGASIAVVFVFCFVLGEDS